MNRLSSTAPWFSFGQASTHWGRLSLIGLVLWAGSSASLAADQAPEAVEGEYVVIFKEETTRAEMKGIAANWSFAKNGVNVVESIPRLRCARVRTGGAMKDIAPTDFRAKMIGEAHVEAVEPNYIYRLDERRPNDPQVGKLWHLAAIRTFQAWDTTTNSADVVVAVVDNGCLLNHEDLRGNLWVNSGEIPNNDEDDDNNGFIDDMNGFDFYDGDPFPMTAPMLDPEDETMALFEDHATHVAGIIGAVGNNATGITGVTWKAKVMVVRVGAGMSNSLFSCLEGIYYAMENGATVINASWGAEYRSLALERAIQAANAEGVVFVAAAGNEALDNDAQPHFPSSYNVPNLIAVAATGPDDRLAEFSCFGRSSVHVAAPGVDILSTVPAGNWSADADIPLPTSGYELMSGTSMATPVVVGVIAIMRAVNPNLTPEQIRAILIKTSDPVDSLRGRCVSGGRINMERAIEMARSSTSSPPPPSRSPSPSPPEQKKSREERLREIAERIDRQLGIDPKNDPTQSPPSKGLAPEDDDDLPERVRVFVVGVTENNELSTEQLQTALSSEDATAQVLDVAKTGEGDLRVKVRSRRSTRSLAVLLEGIEGVRYAEPNIKFQLLENASP